eukprot:4251968-Karenia_brevis.AAC.1
MPGVRVHVPHHQLIVRMDPHPRRRARSRSQRAQARLRAARRRADSPFHEDRKVCPVCNETK